MKATPKQAPTSKPEPKLTDIEELLETIQKKIQDAAKEEKPESIENSEKI